MDALMNNPEHQNGARLSWKAAWRGIAARAKTVGAALKTGIQMAWEVAGSQIIKRLVGAGLMLGSLYHLAPKIFSVAPPEWSTAVAVLGFAGGMCGWREIYSALRRE